MSLIALLLFVFAGGRVLERSPRVGRRATRIGPSDAPETFMLFGFQTRREDGSWNIFGAWLHRWQFDRLPELWNVLQGDLALVGVKPLTTAEAANLNESWHYKRYQRPAGFTGLWYVQTLATGDLDAALIADAYYVATSTWRTDLGLLGRTPAAWLRQLRTQPNWMSTTPEYYGHIDNVSGT